MAAWGAMALVLMLFGPVIVLLFLVCGLAVAAYFAVTEWLDERRVRRGHACDDVAIEFTDRMRTRLADQLHRRRSY